MNVKYAFTPLALALAALVSTGVYAEQKHGQGQSQQQNGASATVQDSQGSYGNYVNNQGTENTATVYDAVDGAAGNIGINVTSGNNNQQANAAALATADASFVFGTAARSNIEVAQTGKHNDLDNYSVPNVANLHDAANNTTGNVGINISAGNYNQQKNDMAAAVSETAYIASANASAEQKLSGNTTDNYATLSYGTAPVSLTLNANGTYNGTAGGTTAGTADQIGDVYPDIYNAPGHPAGSATEHIHLSTDAVGAQDLNQDGGALAFNEDGTYTGTETGTSALAGTVSGNIPIVVGFNTPVTNDARLYSALNGVSGNVGVNIAAGGGNQQSNSLAIAAGCTACAAGGGGE